MTQFNSDAVGSLGLTSYGSATTEASDNSLGQDDFLTLMITQLKNQDPTDPVKNEDFVAQLAQFSTVSGIEELSTAFEELSTTLSQNQTLQAASLVGNKVLVPAQSVELSEGQGVSGAISLPASASGVSVSICSATGEVVRSIDLGTLSAGLQEFAWDGLLEDGTAAPAGNYDIKVTAQTDGGTESITTMLDGQVQSVTSDEEGGGLVLSVLGIGNVGFSDVYRIG